MQYFPSFSLRAHSRVFALEDDPGQEIFPPHAWRRLVSTTILTEECEPLDTSEDEYKSTGRGAPATYYATAAQGSVSSYDVAERTQPLVPTVPASATTAGKSTAATTNSVSSAHMSAVTVRQNAATAEPGPLATAFERSLTQRDNAIPGVTPMLHAPDGEERKSQHRSSREWVSRRLSSTPAAAAAASATSSATNRAMSSVVNSSKAPTAGVSAAHATPMASATVTTATAATTTLASTSTRISAPQQALKQAPRKRPHDETTEEAKSAWDATESSRAVLLFVPEDGEDDFADVACLKRSRHTSKLNPHGFKPAKQEELRSLPPMERQVEMRKILTWRRKTRNWRERQRLQNTDADSDNDIGSSCANVADDPTECDAAEPPSVLECGDNAGFADAVFSSSPSYSPSIDFDGDYEDGEANAVSKRHKSGVAVAPARVAPALAATTLYAPQKNLYSAAAQPSRPSSASVVLPPAATAPPTASLVPQLSTALLYQPREGDDDYADVAYSLVSGRYTSEANPHGFPPKTQEYLLRLTPEERHRAMQLKFACRRRTRAWRKRNVYRYNSDSDEDEDFKQ